MAILVILAAITLVGVRSVQRRAEDLEVHALLARTSALVEGEYELARGAAPPDDLPPDSRAPNDVNTGSEALVAALAERDAPWAPPDSKDLGNTDGDEFPRSMTSYGTRDAFELVDRFGNPIAYFRSGTDGGTQRVRARRSDTRELADQTVRAVEDPKTRQPFHPTGFQLISAGRDGVFGTEDDLANFEMPAR